MAFVETNPRYRTLLEQAGLTAPEHFLALPAVIVSGHPDRHVARVTVGTGPSAVAGFLKREHRIPWRDRFTNAWAGFGFVSKSSREAFLLHALQQTGIGCPEWIAVGEDGRGRAFLLVKEIAGAMDLRLLCGAEMARGRKRRWLARQLGQALARMHEAGFNHPDLYAKHVLVDPGSGQICFLDWQRSRYRRRVGWAERCWDLAALDATLTDNLATPRERLVCLHAYLRHVHERGGTALSRPPLADLLRQIQGRVRRLLPKRSVQAVRCEVLPAPPQLLLWLDGEALCVTQDFWDELRGEVPDWLPLRSAAPGLWERTTRDEVELPGNRHGLLVRRWRHQPLAWLWAALRGKRPASPELRQAAAIFHRQRQGVEAPRLLAFGQRRAFPWRTESFLLTEVAAVGRTGSPSGLLGRTASPSYEERRT
jgi:tRNA A-37 threonylcarbamoyl transferase component Bud32